MENNVTLKKDEAKNPSLLGMITSPSLQFERMKEKAPITLPLIIMIIFMAITGGIVAYLTLNNPAVKQAYAATGITIPVGVTMGLGAAGGAIGGAIMYFISAAFYKICMIFMGNDTPYQKLLALVIYTSIISSLGLLVNVIIGLLTGGYETSYTSLAPLAGNNKTLQLIARNFDIFNIWYYVVIALGLKITAGLSKNKAIILVVIIFLLGTGIGLVGGAFQK